jgi:hypothetical protein
MCEDRAEPGSEVLRAQVVRAGGLTEVVVHVLGRDSALLPVLVEVLEEALARQLAAAPDDGRQAAIDQGRLLGAAALAAKPEPKRRA